MEIANPVKTLTPTKSGAKNALFFVLWALLGLGLIVGIYLLLTRGVFSWKKIKLIVAKDAAGYENPAAAESILIDGVRSIVAEPMLMKQARSYAKSTGVPIEQVLVDNAEALAKQFGYIKPKASTASQPAADQAGGANTAS